MVQLQIISKIITSGDFSIVEENFLDDSYFVEYKEEFNFIKQHLNDYNNVPDKATFLAKFPNVTLVDVTESDLYLLNTIREEHLYQLSVPIIQKSADLLKSDANAAAEYLMEQIKLLQPNYNITATDIISDAEDRYNQFIERREHQDEWFFTTGFKELDDIVHGFQRGEELVVLFARTNHGKSWVLEKICTHIWSIGFNVGYISPEMSATSVGYRFDTLYNNFSNIALMWGKDEVNADEYKAYIDKLKQNEGKFVIATPKDLGNKVTVSKLKEFVKKYNIQLLAVDGIKYLTDERYRRGDSTTTSLTNISEDLMGLSIELNIPVIVVVQANRSGVVDKDSDDTPELESIRDSDGISHNASKVLSLRHKDNFLEIGIKKQRFGAVGGKLKYNWDIDKGEFMFVPSFDDAEDEEETERKVIDARNRFNSDIGDVF